MLEPTLAVPDGTAAGIDEEEERCRHVDMCLNMAIMWIRMSLFRRDT